MHGMWWTCLWWCRCRKANSILKTKMFLLNSNHVGRSVHTKAYWKVKDFVHGEPLHRPLQKCWNFMIFYVFFENFAPVCSPPWVSGRPLQLSVCSPPWVPVRLLQLSVCLQGGRNNSHPKVRQMFPAHNQTILCNWKIDSTVFLVDNNE